MNRLEPLVRPLREFRRALQQMEISLLSPQLNIRERRMKSALYRAHHDLYDRDRFDIEKILQEGLDAAELGTEK